MDIENEEFLLFLKCAQQNKLRYLCVGDYAVNFHGYHRYTEDLDIWIAPTNDNKILFLETLRCMHYSESELESIKEEDFTTHFICTLGESPYVIDVLTVVHKNINFDQAEKESITHLVGKNIELKLVPYNFLKDIKLLSRRGKDMDDVVKLEKLRQDKK